jgi:putative transposase
MVRPLRVQFEGALYHVTARGNEKKTIFRDERDRWKFLSVLEDVVEEYEIVIHAWVLMNNHYHLLIETPLGNLSSAMRQLNGVYTLTFNKRHKRVGHLFQGRFKALVVEGDQYLLELSRYIVLNPVKAKFVESPEQWKWSSYRSTVGLCDRERWLTTDWIVAQFGKDVKSARARYKKYVLEGSCVSASPWENVKHQLYLGNEKIEENIRTAWGKREQPSREISREQSKTVLPGSDVILRRIQYVYGIRGWNHRDASTCEAKRVAMYLLKTRARLKQREIGDIFKIGYSAVSHGISDVKRRILSDREFSRKLQSDKFKT